MTDRPPAPILTPCVMVCAVDGESGFCLGCFRTLREVASWRQFTDVERAQIMAELPSRQDKIAPEKLTLTPARRPAG